MSGGDSIEGGPHSALSPVNLMAGKLAGLASDYDHSLAARFECVEPCRECQGAFGGRDLPIPGRVCCA